MKLTISELKIKHANNGGKFFDRDTMKFFSTKIETNIYKSGHFITSEKEGFESTKRMFSVRFIEHDYRISTVGRFGQFKTKQQAVDFIKELKNLNEGDLKWKPYTTISFLRN